MIAKVGKIVMNFEIKGKGAPATLISGMASGMSAWALQVPSFSMSFMTVCLENRGTGKTDAPEGPYSIEMMADDTANLLDVIGAESSNLVGFGMGGRIALEMAIRHPSRVNGLVLCSCSPRATSHEVDLLERLRSSIIEGSGRYELAKNETNRTLSPKFFEDGRVAEGVIRARMAGMSGTEDLAFLRQIDAVLSYDAKGRLAEVRCPTMVVAGSKDRLVPADLQCEMAGEIPGASCVVVDSAHMVLVEAAKDFNKNAIGFLLEKGI
jgi:3-oxoadipate enol-lactonase